MTSTSSAPTTPPDAPPPDPAGPSSRARIIAPAVVLLLGAGALGLGVRHYARPEAAPAPAVPENPYAFKLEPMLVKLAVADRDAGPEFNQAVAAFRNHGLDENHFMLKVSGEVLLPLTEARNALKNIPPMPEEMQPRIDAAIAYANLRGEMWLRMARRALSVTDGTLLEGDEQERLDKARAAAHLDALELPPPAPPQPPPLAPQQPQQ